jgi:hypothetical protein
MLQKIEPKTAIVCAGIDGANALGAALIQQLDGIDLFFLDGDIKISDRIRKSLKAVDRAWTSGAITESCWSALDALLRDLQTWTVKEWDARTRWWFDDAANHRTQMQSIVDSIGLTIKSGNAVQV